MHGIRWLAVALALSIPQPGVGARAATGRIFSTFDVPGADFTIAHGINDRGDVVGYYGDSSGFRGFLRTAAGFTRIDVVNSQLTAALGVNNRRQVVGYYRDAHSITHGFVWEKGTFTTIDVPGFESTAVLGVNARGQLVGLVEVVSEMGPQYGFVWTRGDSSILPVGAITGINARGDMVAQGAGSFIISRGSMAPIVVPGADIVSAWTINARGEVVGEYQRGVNAHGFLYTANGATTLDVPGARDTRAHGINARGDICGAYQDADGVSHGFVLSALAARSHSAGS